MSSVRSYQTSAENTAGGSPGVRWRMFAPAIVVIWIVGMIDKTGVGIIATDKGFLSAMHLAGKPATIGLLTTITLVFYGASMPVWGMLVDRFGPRRCALFGLVFWAVSTLIAGFANNVPTLLAARALLGVSEGFLWPLSNALTARWFPLAERARAKSLWIGGINLGFALSGFVITGAIDASSWRGAFFALTAMAVVLCLPAAWFFLRDDPAAQPKVSKAELDLIRHDSIETTVGEHGTVALSSWTFAVVVVAWIANNMGVFGLASWFPTYLKTEQHVSGASASAFIALAFVLCIAVGPVVGLGMDRTRRKAIFLFAGFALAAVFLLLSRVVGSVGFQLAAVIVAIVGIEGFTTLAGQGVLHSMMPTRRMGRASGLMTGIGNFVGAFGSTIMGALIGVGGFTAAFTFLTGVFVVGGGCALVLHRLKY
ncbi:MAG TPA: MFS transporter [Pseudonocardiaceae bacterium]|jgi:MFS family permease|nr:MFS transporter [Pseudonocardiaceae bacterium]